MEFSKELALNKLRGLGYKEVLRREKDFTGNIFSLDYIDPHSGDRVPFYFWDAYPTKSTWGPLAYKAYPREVLEKSTEALEPEERYAPELYGEPKPLILPKKRSGTFFVRQYSGEPEAINSVNYPNPEFLRFKSSSLQALLRLIEREKKAARAKGDSYVKVALGHPCRTNEVSSWDLPPEEFIVIPVGGAEYSFRKGDFVCLSGDTSIPFIIKAGPKPLNPYERRKYLVQREDLEGSPRWVKVEDLYPINIEEW